VVHVARNSWAEGEKLGPHGVDQIETESEQLPKTVNDLTKTGWGGDGSSDKISWRWLTQTHPPLTMCHVSAAFNFIGWSRDQVRSLKDLSTLRTASLHARVKIKSLWRAIKLNLAFLFSSFKSHTKTRARDSKKRDREN